MELLPWIAFTIIFPVALLYMYFNGQLPLPDAIGLAALILTTLVVLMVMIVHNNIHRREKKPSDMDYRKRLEKIHKRRPGKDIYEVCDNIRRQYYIVMLTAALVVAVALPVTVIGKLREIKSDISIWWGIIMSVAILAISIFLGRKQDFGFITSLELKLKIRSLGLEPIYVNNDFMMATYHDLVKGLMAIGQSYCVIFSQKNCFILDMNNISKVEHTSKAFNLNGATAYTHTIHIMEKDSSVTRIPAKDLIAANLILDEFRRHGIATEDLTGQG